METLPCHTRRRVANVAATDWSGIATVIGSSATFVSACGLAVAHFRGDRPRHDDKDDEETLADLEQQMRDLRERVEEQKRKNPRRRGPRRLDLAWIHRRVTA